MTNCRLSMKKRLIKVKSESRIKTVPSCYGALFWNFIKEKKIFPLGIFLQKEDRKTRLCKNRWMIGIAWSENNLALISTKHSLAGKTFKILMISQLYDIFCTLSLQPAFLEPNIWALHVYADWLPIKHTNDQSKMMAEPFKPWIRGLR